MFSRRVVTRVLAATAIAGAGGYVGYEQYWERRRNNALVLPTDLNSNELDKITAMYKRVGSQKDKAQQALRCQEILLYQYATCPFSSKVRTFLESHGVPYKRIEVDPFNKAELKGLTYKKVPQLHIGNDGQAIHLVDSEEIVTILSPIFNQSITDDISKWRKWGVDVLARYIVLNMNGSITGMPANVRFITSKEEFSSALKAKYLAAGTLMFAVAHLSTKKKLEKLGYDTSDLRGSMRSEVGKWCTTVSDSKQPFHGGKQPDVADTDIYGVIASIKGHPLYEDISKQTTCAMWMCAMEQHLKAHAVLSATEKEKIHKSTSLPAV